MATAKLWWNGSAWVSSQTKWVYVNTASGNYCHVYADFYIIAYDDISIGFSGTIGGGGSGTAVVSGTRTITENNTTIASFSMSDVRSQTRTATISSPKAPIG